MFERFTEHARHVIELAKQEAQRFGNEFVGTEHLLWGLAKENHGVAAATLEHFNVNLKPLRKEVEALLNGRPHVEVVEKLPQSQEVKDAISHAIEEARSMHHNYVGTEHLLLGLLRNPESIAAQVLTNLGLQLDAARDTVRDVAARQHAAGEQA
jgi:ATP-dependent Clp protease ATP-binding subunit ClpC